MDSAERALDLWNRGTYAKWGFVFGGDGGGECLAFDMRHSAPHPVVSFDLIDPHGSIRQVAPTWEDFLTLIDTEDTWRAG